MTEKKSDLDEATIKVMKQVLAMLPKQNKELKVGRKANKKKRGSKVRASSSKQSAS